MATSGATNWTLTRTQAITMALRKLAVLPSGGTPSTNQLSDAADSLNAIVKAFHADGMPIWAVTSTNFTVVSGTSTYTIGPSQTINTVATPLKVLQAWRTPSGSLNIQMNVYNRFDFNSLTGNTAVGTPVNFYYQPQEIAGVATGTIKLWPTPNESTTVISFDYQRPFENMDNPADNFDFPSYWMMAIVYTLAWAMAPEFGIPTPDRTVLANEAKYWHDQALSYGQEEGSVTFVPDSSRRLG